VFCPKWPLKIFELLKQKLVNYATIEGSLRREIQLVERVISMINFMNNEDQFAFEIVNDVYTDIFKHDEVELIYE